jgi:membrane protease YdiL (CAAX protease family)
MVKQKLLDNFKPVAWIFLHPLLNFSSTILALVLFVVPTIIMVLLGLDSEIYSDLLLRVLTPIAGLILIMIIIRISKTKFSEFGFDFSYFWKDFLWASLAVIVMLGLASISIPIFEVAENNYLEPKNIFTNESVIQPLLPETTFGEVTENPSLFAWKTFFLILSFFFYYLFFVALSEDLVRTFFLIKIKKGWGIYAGVLISAALFGLIHISNSIYTVILTFFLGILFNLLWVLRGKRIVPVILAHALYNIVLAIDYYFVTGIMSL